MDFVQTAIHVLSTPIAQINSRIQYANISQNLADSGTVSEEGDSLDTNSENIFNMTRLQLTDWTEAPANRLSNESSDFEDAIITSPITSDIISSSEEDDLNKRLRLNLSNSDHRKKHCKRGRHSSEEELLNIIGWSCPIKNYSKCHSKISGKDGCTTLRELKGFHFFDAEVENLHHEKVLYSLVDKNWNCGYYDDLHGTYNYSDQVSPRKRHCSSPPRPSLNFYKMQKTSLMENQFATQTMSFSSKSLNDFNENFKSSQNVPQFCFRSIAKTCI